MSKTTALQRLDKAKRALRDLGLETKPVADAPIAGLLDKIYDIDKDSVAVIAKTLTEAQVAALSDDVAYNNHDLHDGLRAGLFTVEEICALPIVGPAFAEVDRKYPGLDQNRRRHEALRRVFGVMVEDVLITARRYLQEINPASASDIRAAGQPIIRFSDHLFNDLKQIRAFLFKRMYRAPSVVVERERVTRIVRDLFPAYMADPTLLPENWQQDVARVSGDDTGLARIVLDYVAGMTDRFAILEHERLFGAG